MSGIKNIRLHCSYKEMREKGGEREREEKRD